MKNDDRFFKYVRNFLMVYLPKNRCYSENTVKAYRDTINLLRTFISRQKGLSFAKITFKMLDHVLLEEFLDWLQAERKCSVSTRNHRLAALKSFFKYAAQEDASLMMNYIELGKVPMKKTSGTRITFMSEKALSVLFQQPNENTRLGIRDRFFMIFLYDTGARIQEVLDLRLMDLHLNDSVPCVYLTGKGQKTRAVPLLKKTIQHLNLYMKHYHSEAIHKNDDFSFTQSLKAKPEKCPRTMLQDF